MRLIHRVTDKPIQFPRGHRGPQVRLIAAAHLKGSPGAALLRRQGSLTKRSHKRDVSPREKRVSFPREGHDTSDTIVAANCSASPRDLAAINYPGRAAN